MTENHESDRMLSMHSLEGVKIKGGIDSGRLSGSHRSKTRFRII